jgi:aspartyl aminopeptidase
MQRLAARAIMSSVRETVAAGSPAAAQDLLAFIEASPSPFHAVAECVRRLEAAGFARLSERSASWALAPGGKYFTTRNQSAIIAFAVGGRFTPASGALTIAAAHTDSPCLRVKPVSTLKRAGFLQVGVETYGGGIWATWLDRDLSLAGRAVVASAAGGFDSRLVRLRAPLLRVPSLAIHLNRDVNSDGLKLNAESHLAPVLATAVRDALAAPAAPAPAAAGAGAGAGAPAHSSAGARHHGALVAALAAELGVAAADVHDFDLSLYDTQPPALGGVHAEFVFAPRLDNLCMTYCTLAGLLASTAPGAAVPLADDPNVRVMAAFDHEEVGSSSVPGAASTLLEDTFARLVPDAAARAAAARKSILVSADMAHAQHPNYAALHEENHRPAMHAGVVIKSNANQRYATTNVTAFLLRRLAEEARVPAQSFVNRQDMGCGSTIGPILSTRSGIKTVDVGLAQLSMHSVREMMGVDDVAHGVGFFSHLYSRYAALEATVDHAD